MTLDDKIINLDINKTNMLNLTAKQYDTTGARSFTFRLLKDSQIYDLTGLTVRVGGTKADNTTIFNDCTIVDAKNGTVRVDLTTQMQVVAGNLNLELIIMQNGTRLSTVPFVINIVKSATNLSDVVSSNELDALNNALYKVDFANKRIDNLASLKDGSTTGDAELTDIRVGADGAKYNNAGEAVRGQVEQVSNKVVELAQNTCVCGNNKINKMIIELYFDKYDAKEKYRIRQAMIANNQYRIEIEKSDGTIVASTSLNSIANNNIVEISETNASGVTCYAYIDPSKFTTDNVYSLQNKEVTSKCFKLEENPIINKYLNGHSVNAYDFNFRPQNDADTNVAAMQRLLDRAGRIIVDVAGDYKINAEMLLKDNTEIIFSEGCYISVEKKNNVVPQYIFINKGAYDKNINNNITIKGYKVKSNGIITGNRVDGLRGYLALWHVKNVHIDGYQCHDIPAGNFGFGLCDFNNVLIENCSFIGNGVGFQCSKGNRLTIRKSEFCMFDDSIALNAWDWFKSNPQIGNITNVLIENCYEMPITENHIATKDYSGGFFVRMLGGCWTDWKEGMTVATGTTVRSNGYLYRVDTPSTPTVSKTRPVCDFGSAIVVDGIRWVNFGASNDLSAICKNIHIENCISNQKKGYATFSIMAQNDGYNRSYVDGANYTPCEDIFINKCTINGLTPFPIAIYGNLFNMNIINSTFDCNNINDAIIGTHEIFGMANYYTPCINMFNNVIKGSVIKLTKNVDENTRKLNIQMANNWSYGHSFLKDKNTTITNNSPCDTPSLYTEYIDNKSIT